MSTNFLASASTVLNVRELVQQPARRTAKVGHENWFKIIILWLERSRQRKALATLDDRLLADIGLTRKDARRESSKPFWK